MDSKLPNCCFIKEQYFIDHADFKKMLDSGNFVKQSKRTHLCISFIYNNNAIYVPLRNKLGLANRPFGKIGYPVPSKSRPNAGLDYRYSLIINDSKYIEYQDIQKIPDSQADVLNNDYEIIKEEVLTYLQKYIKMAMKNRIDKEPLFRESSLINFHEELGIIKVTQEVAPTLESEQ